MGRRVLEKPQRRRIAVPAPARRAWGELRRRTGASRERPASGTRERTGVWPAVSPRVRSGIKVGLLSGRDACVGLAGRLPFGGRRVLAGLGLGVVLLGACGAWIATQARQAQGEAAAMQADGARLRQQLAVYDLADAGATLARLREHSARAHELTDDPVWAVAAAVPVLGRDLRAARETSAVLADVTQAARPLESALPRLDPHRRAGGAAGAAGGPGATAVGGPDATGGPGATGATGATAATAVPGAAVDVVALADLAHAVPGLSLAVDDGAARLSTVDPRSLRPPVARGVAQVRSLLDAARGPLAGAEPLTRTLPAMLGASGPRTWVVLLQQSAEARGTGGLVGAYAVLRSDRGRLDLVQARSRAALDRGPSVPDAGVPQELRELWGRDLREWAGLNLSPNFPWTGRLVADGWAADGRRGRLDYVAGVDAHVVSALLAGTGPVRLRDGTTVTQANAVDFLSRGVYARYAAPAGVDAVTTELVERVFSRVGGGELNLPALIRAMSRPVEQRRLLMWSARADEQQWLQRLPVGGALPSVPGAWAMAVVNNGGGNKLDAYLKVHTAYQPGVCAEGQRVGRIVVDVRNTAPRAGLPRYVTVRSDLAALARRGVRRATKPVVGSNRVILDIYGPVAAQAAMVTVDGRPVVPVSGSDVGHLVSRVVVEVDPGRSRRVQLVLVAPAVPGDAGTLPQVQVQPMVQQPTVSTEPLTPCSAVARSG